MILLGDEAQVDAHFNPFGDSTNFDSRFVQGLRQTYHRLINHLGCIQSYSEVTRVKWKLVSVRFKIVLILTQNRCIVYAERTICSKIILDAPDGTPR
jgi:hypothetical protein